MRSQPSREQPRGGRLAGARIAGEHDVEATLFFVLLQRSQSTALEEVRRSGEPCSRLRGSRALRDEMARCASSRARCALRSAITSPGSNRVNVSSTALLCWHRTCYHICWHRTVAQPWTQHPALSALYVSPSRAAVRCHERCTSVTGSEVSSRGFNGALTRPRREERGFERAASDVWREGVACLEELHGRHGRDLRRRIAWQRQPRWLAPPEVPDAAMQRLYI
mmetsp:Transcript_10272/g.33659  ORF Transcript_10272/g.33659 Transcript_10272/m.33659 type:complete len:223 (+) Transcript_10272:1004-1672(+)